MQMPKLAADTMTTHAQVIPGPRLEQPERQAMKISYDHATDSLYIHLTDRASVDSDEVQDGVVLDFDAQGAVVGIDLQRASQWVDVKNLSLSKLLLGQLQAA